MSDDFTQQQLNEARFSLYKGIMNGYFSYLNGAFGRYDSHVEYKERKDHAFGAAFEMTNSMDIEWVLTLKWGGEHYLYVLLQEKEFGQFGTLFQKISPDQIPERTGSDSSWLKLAIDNGADESLCAAIIKKMSYDSLTEIYSGASDLQRLIDSNFAHWQKDRLIEAYNNRFKELKTAPEVKASIPSTIDFESFNPMQEMQALLDNPNANEINANKFAKDFMDVVKTTIDDLTNKQSVQTTKRDEALSAILPLKLRIELMDSALAKLVDEMSTLEPEQVFFLKSIMNQIFKKKPLDISKIIDLKAMRTIVDNGSQSAHEIITACEQINQKPELQIAALAALDEALAYGIDILKKRSDNTSTNMAQILESKKVSINLHGTFIDDIFANTARMRASASMTMIEMDRLSDNISFAAGRIIEAAVSATIAFQQARLSGGSLPIAYQERLARAREKIADFRQSALGIEDRLNGVQEIQADLAALPAPELV